MHSVQVLKVYLVNSSIWMKIRSITSDCILKIGHFRLEKKRKSVNKKRKKVVLRGIEPRTFLLPMKYVNHYTTKSGCKIDEHSV